MRMATPLGHANSRRAIALFMHANHGWQTNKIHQTCRLYSVPGTLTLTQAGTVLYVSLAQHLPQSRAVCVCAGSGNGTSNGLGTDRAKVYSAKSPKKSKKLLSGWQSQLLNVQLPCTTAYYI